MKLRRSLKDKLVKQARKIAVERDTTLNGLVRDHLKKLAAENAASGPNRGEREALEKSFSQLRIKVGNRNWKREDPHQRA